MFVRYENWKTYLKNYPMNSVILCINFIVFALIFLNDFSFSSTALLECGALTNAEPFVLQRWRYITSMFMHGSFDHMLFNSFSLFVFAPPLEKRIGSIKYFILYIVAGVIGNLLTVLYYDALGTYTISVGASGAIYGIYGAFLYAALFCKRYMDAQSKKIIYILLAFGIVSSLFLSHVNQVAHFGGLGTGFLMGSLFLFKTKKW